ncbi:MULTISPECIES: hypothetical protein [Legionella]|uniref:Uncharacterized protein n=1 Tax=Legionella maceachernii TaxID=466 RepID=A0A0W0W3P0_9GAMM|nr:hypothetical protein [Legionella maceachernii]KTD27076.1 hypothetical protein Lmac_1324 [Legionella maceachernii]SKA04495.1 hypothetical protein SAMN02745128_01882 [Legionella maceachernii]SUP00275.1 chromosome segregation protein SMC [Legionella maceachernii]
MPKSTHLTNIFSLLQAAPVEEKNHFLFLLGTDTVFTQRPTALLEKNPKTRADRRSYKRGETLSYAAQAAVTLLGEQEQVEIGEKDNPLSYSSPSVDVVNGPTTLGSEVGERIALAVSLALRAAASGKERLFIPAHSRGAVEGVMLMSELKRIKKALREEPHKSLYDILCAAPATDDNTYIAEAMKKLFSPADNDTYESRQALRARLDKLDKYPFLIDPVPGGSKFGLKMLRWHSPRFYEEPECSDYELLLYRDERTCCFTPIVPKGMKAKLIPGHHGTGSGNRYNQQSEKVPDTLHARDTTTVQDLLLCKMFDFFDRYSNGRFRQSEPHQLDLEHKEYKGYKGLDQVLNEFLNANEADRSKQLLALYTKILENDKAYRHFADSGKGYAWLRTQYATGGKRYVHYQVHYHQSMETVAPTLHEDFINEEHALLCLRDYIQFDEFAKAPLHEMVGKITDGLAETIDKMLESTEVIALSDNDEELERFAAQSDTKPETLKILRLLQNEQGCKIFFSGLSILVDAISQKYLRNNLSAEEYKQLRDVIEQPFILLKAKKKEAAAKQDFPAEYQKIIDQCDDMIQQGTKQTIEMHYRSIIEQADALWIQIKHRLASPEHFNAVFQIFVENLTKGENVPNKVREIQAFLAEIKPDSIDSIQNGINSAIDSLGELPENEISTIKGFIANKQREFLQSCFDAHQTSVKDYLINLERLYKLANNLYNDFPSLQNLVSDKKIDIEPQELNFRALGLIQAGGALLDALVKERKFNLRQQPDYISQKFFNLIKQEAIKLGTPSPEIEDLQQQLEQQLRKTAELEKTLHGDSRNALQARQSITELKLQLLSASSTLEDKNSEIALQQQQIEALKQQIEKNTGEIERIESACRNVNETINALLSEKEINKAGLISYKLLPPTNKYLDHLLRKAQKYKSDLPEDLNTPLPNLSESDFSSPSAKKEYDLIVDKFNFVLGLKNKLNDTKNYPLPSQRVDNFSQALQEKNKLDVHRDEAWIRYTKTCFAVLGIIITGIIPGAAYLLYCAANNKPSPLFFNHYTRGERYLAECQKELNPVVSPVQG